MSVLQLLREYQQIMLKSYARSDPILYSINKSINIYHKENGLDPDGWKQPSVHHRKRKELTFKDKDRLQEIASKLMSMEHSHALKYYINSLYIY